MRASTRLARIASMIGIASACQTGFGIARWMGGQDDKKPPRIDAELPADVKQSLMSIIKSVTINRERFVTYASGSVIKKQVFGGKAYIWVLMAQHSFGVPEGGRDLKFTTTIGDATFTDDKAFTGLIVEDKPVDLAVLRMVTPDPTKVPENLLELKYGTYKKDDALNKALKEVVVAGSGNYATEVVLDRESFGNHHFLISKRDAGSLRAGVGAIARTGLETLKISEDKVTGTYTGQVLVHKLRFNDVPKDKSIDVANVLFATAFVTSGDSGGATLQKQDSVWTIVGVHITSTARPGEAKDGDESDDTSVGGDAKYLQFIVDSTQNLGPWPPPFATCSRFVLPNICVAH